MTKIITITMPATEYTDRLEALIYVGAPQIQIDECSTDRACIVERGVKPWLLKGDKVSSITTEGETTTVELKVKAVRREVEYKLISLREREIITSYNY